MALGRLHLDAILAAFGHAIGASLGRPLTKGLTIRDLRQNLSQLRLAPDYIDVLVLGMDLTLGEAGRQRALPPDPPPLGARRDPRLDPGPQPPGGEGPAERPVEDADAPCRGQRHGAGRRRPHRQSLSLAALQSLQVGQILEIPRQAVEEIQLAIPQPGGRTALLAQGRLGAYQNNKVIKLATPPDRRVVVHIERALRPAGHAPEAEPGRPVGARAPRALEPPATDVATPA